MNDKPIGYGQLSNSLKVLVIGGWTFIALMLLAFLIGFIQG